MKSKMRIGIFDSGLGGLVVAREIRKAMPEYDYVFLGDTKRLPYGNKSKAWIYRNAVRAVEYLFKEDCVLVIVACNTVSSQALRKLQQEWLPKSKYKGRRVLGVIRPTAESIGKSKRVGLIGTMRTVKSTAYFQELKKVNKNIKLKSKATPKLVPMIEEGKYDEKILKNYLSSFKNSEALILGCTHYGLLKKEMRRILGKKVKIIAQEKLIPKKLKNYLARHGEIGKKISSSGKFEILLTKRGARYDEFSREWFGKVKPKLINLK